jgi:hypothetical protein
VTLCRTTVGELVEPRLVSLSNHWHGSCNYYSENKAEPPNCFILKRFDSLNRSKIKHQGVPNDSIATPFDKLRDLWLQNDSGNDKGQKNGNREDGIPD